MKRAVARSPDRATVGRPRHSGLTMKITLRIWRQRDADTAGRFVTYQVDVKQYVAAVSGVISGFHGGSGTSAIVVFALR